MTFWEWNRFLGDRKILILSRNVSWSLRIAGILVREMASLPFQMMWTLFSLKLHKLLQLMAGAAFAWNGLVYGDCCALLYLNPARNFTLTCYFFICVLFLFFCFFFSLWHEMDLTRLRWQCSFSPVITWIEQISTQQYHNLQIILQFTQSHK